MAREKGKALSGLIVEERCEATRSFSRRGRSDKAFDDPLIDLKRRQRRAAYGDAVRPVIPRPAHGAECTRCGMCCVVKRCFIGRAMFGDDGSECHALEWSLNGASCGIMANPRRYLPTRVQIEGATRFREAAKTLLGAGVGCILGREVMSRLKSKQKDAALRTLGLKLR